jgi:hypothetical protein
MATKVLVIITDDKVYSTYVETICFVEEYSDEAEQEEAIVRAKSSAFSYACSFGFVYVDTIVIDGNLTDDDIFDYLTKHKI